MAEKRNCVCDARLRATRQTKGGRRHRCHYPPPFPPPQHSPTLPLCQSNVIVMSPLSVKGSLKDVIFNVRHCPPCCRRASPLLPLLTRLNASSP